MLDVARVDGQPTVVPLADRSCAILAGSVFVGWSTPLGPLYLGYGIAEGGQDSAYLFLGRTF